MKRRLIIIATLLAAGCFSLRAQEPSGFDKFLKQIWFPTEFGIATPVGQGMNGGLLTRVSLEWRQQPQNGLCVSAHLDSRFNSYTDKLPVGTNLTDGDVQFDDIYLGVGYRKMLGERFGLALYLHGGVSTASYQSIVVSSYTPTSEEMSADGVSMGPYYAFERTSAAMPAAKLTAYWEFYIAPDFCVYLTTTYAQHLTRSPFASSFAEDGSVLVSFGFNAAIF